MKDQFERFVDWRQTGKISGPMAAIIELKDKFRTEHDHSPGVNYAEYERPYDRQSLETVLETGEWSDNDRDILQQALDARPEELKQDSLS